MSIWRKVLKRGNLNLKCLIAKSVVDGSFRRLVCLFGGISAITNGGCFSVDIASGKNPFAKSKGGH
jgi:hypothetical protein